MSESVTLYYNPMSRARVVHWLLEELEADYEIKLLDFQKHEHKSTAFLAVNPMGKVPAIVHRGTVVTECAAICAYLADAFPKAGLAPTSSDSTRGSYYRWLFFGSTCLDTAIVDKLLARPVPQQTSSIGYGTYADTLNTLEKALLPGSFILGDRFSAADVYLSSAVSWGLMTRGLEPRPVFESYRERCTNRPGFRRFMEKSGKLMEQGKTAKSA